jgi:RHS repeat-associated protein
MRSCLRLVVVFAAAASLLSALSGAAFGDPASRRDEAAIGDTSGLFGSLALPAMEPLVAGQRVADEEAVRANPESAIAREASSSAYEGLSAANAEKVAHGAFPRLVDDPDGGPPPLPQGAKLVGFPSDYVASFVLPDKTRGLVDSVEPIALGGRSGRTPVDLGLHETAGGFEPARPVVNVRIPRHLSEGAQLVSDGGVSLTPVDDSGAPLEGKAGTIDGTTVFYGDTEEAHAGVRDVDTIVKPETLGLSEETLLRSQRSPDRLYFKVHSPNGASLRWSGHGPVRVLDAGQPIAEILLPSAQDAEGTPVPVSLSVKGDMLTVTVNRRPGQYRYPVLVDPVMGVEDEQFTTSAIHKTNWHYVPSGTHFSATEHTSEKTWTIHIDGTHTETESGALVYTTQGVSSITNFSIEGSAETTNSHVESMLQLVAPPKKEGEKAEVEKSEPLPEKWAHKYSVCGKCTAPYMGAAGNSALYDQQSIRAGGGVGGETTLTKAAVTIEQEQNTEVSMDTTHPTVDGGRTNVLYGSGAWLGPNTGGALEVHAKDPGIGVSYTGVAVEGWEEKFPTYENDECTGGVECPSEFNKGIVYNSKMPEGEHLIEADACNMMLLYYSPWECAKERSRVLKVDAAPPHNLSLTLGHGGNIEVGPGETHAEGFAEEGTAGTPSSGIKSISFSIDGREVGSPSGSCQPGPCNGLAKWTIWGRNYAAGKHIATLVATDNAGNVASESYTLTVRPATPVALGPGSLNSQSGEYTLNATDASLGGGLSLTRSYNSRHTSAGAQGPLGPQWELGMGGQENLVKQPNGSMVLTDGTGAQTIFETDGKGGFISPAGDTNLTLSSTPCEAGKTEYMLKNAAANATTCFKVPSGGSGEEWAPSVVRGALTADSTTYVYETVEVPSGSGKKITRPKEALAPVPSGVTCSLEVKPVELKHGCRALSFNYATATTAKGEAVSEWGDYNGQMTRVYFTAYDPGTKAMHEVAVAHYLYDAQGRLRTEWDPRISPELKVSYGYDSEGHVTALTPPGQESWTFTYGSMVGDVSSGRLIKVNRAPASAPLWGGEAPQSTEAPKNIEAPRITGTPAVGVRLAVTNGQWLGSPVSYGYQWEDCNTVGGECAPIAGATNPNYTPTDSDVLSVLEAVVTATNGGGSTSASGRVSFSVGALSESSLPSGSHPVATVTGPDGNLWFTDYGTSKIGKVTMAGVITEYALPAGSDPYGITSGPEGNVWFAEEGTSKIGDITPLGAITEYALPAGSQPYGIASGSDKNLWFTDYGTGKVGRITPTGTITEWKTFSSAHPYGITAGPESSLWFTERGTRPKVDKLTTEGVIYNEELPTGSNPGQIVNGPDGNLWFTEEGTNKIGKLTTSWAVTEYGLPSGSNPLGIAPGWDKSLWFTDSGTSRLGRITTSGAISEKSLAVGSHPFWISSGPDLNPWFANYETNKLGKIAISGISEMSEFAVTSGSKPYEMASGPDKNLWFTIKSTSKIGKITTSGVVSEYALPAGSYPYGIASGPDGNLWFADEGTNKIGKITTSGTITEYALPAGSEPAEIAAGPDGNLWFTDIGTSKVGKITTSGTVTEYALPAGSEPIGIAAGPDGNLWFTDYHTSKVGKITTSGTVTEYALPSGSRPWGIVAGPDGEVWFADYTTSKIGKVTTSGTVTEYGLPSGSNPSQIVTGADGNLWFTGESTDKVGKITTLGSISEYAIPTGSKPIGIASGADGNLWIADGSTSKIGKITIPGSNFSIASGSLPIGITSAADGNLWFTGSGTNKIGKVTTSGSVTEYPLPANSEPYGIAAGPDGNVWFADDRSSKIGKATLSGAVTEYSLPAGSKPSEITSGPDGDVWFTDTGTSKIGKITTSGAITEYALPAGSSPDGIAAGPDGELWFVDSGTSKIGKITTAGAVTEYALPAGSKPGGVAAGPDGDLWFTNNGTSKIGKITTSGTVTEYALPSGSGPFEIVPGADNKLWFTEESTNKLGRITTSGTVTEYQLPTGNSPVGIAFGIDNNAWMTYAASGKIDKFTLPSTEGEIVGPAPGSTVEYNVPLSGSGLPNMTEAEVKTWAQSDAPVDATAIFPPDEPQRWPASDYRRATISYYDAKGRAVNVSSPTGGISTTEYAPSNETNDVVRTLSADNRAAAMKEGAKSAEVAKLLDTESTYNSEGTELTETLGPRHLVKLSNGKEVQARNHTVDSYDEGAPSEGGPYRLVTKVVQGAQTETEGEQDVRTVATGYSGQGNLGWKLRMPTSVTADPSGLKLTHTTLYEEATGNVIETRQPKSAGAESAHNSRTVYFGAAANPSYPSCGEHPEWAGLSCETLAGKQPETPGLPALAVHVVTSYNMWGEPLTISTTSGSATRTTTTKYDEAGRMETTETSSSVGTALPKVTFKYDEHSGAQVEQSATVAGKSQSLKAVYSTLGELTAYTDAAENTSTYEYEPEGDGRLIKVNDGKGTQTYSYSEMTGLLSELVDSAAGKFVPSYDVEGSVTGETYPDGLKASYTSDAAGEATGVVYKKETHCTENCEWFKDSVVPSIHGQWMTQTSTLGKDGYVYDGAGRLTEVQATPAGKGCTTRRYVYDEDTNRTSLTTYPPNSKNECATEGGTVEKHTYDEADRLTDTGASYDAFGDITALPAADAGKYELKSTFYVDNQLASSEQNGQTIGYDLDPAHRPSEIVSTGKVVADEVQHYIGSGSSPSWTGETSGKYTRYISGLNGLSAIQHNGETPVLQLSNLHGDIVATTEDSETATGLASTIKEATEYGVPGSETPPKYSWLGSHEVPTELPSGVVGMGARSYIPQLGRFLQKDPTAGGSTNSYGYTNGDPVNQTDLTGNYVEASYMTGFLDEEKVRAVEREAAREAAARAEAERLAAMASEEAEYLASLSGYGEEWEGEEWEEEEEEVAWHGGAKIDSAPALVEEGLFWGPSSGEGADGSSQQDGHSEMIPLCGENETTACAQDTRGKKRRKKKAAGKSPFPYCRVGVPIYAPNDPDAGCCPDPSDPTKTFGKIGDCHQEVQGSIEYKSPGSLDCPEGTTPAVGVLGPGCLLEGEQEREE